jgi:ADP-ribosylglycohydrolase
MRLAPVPLAFRQNIALAIHNAGESSRLTHAAPVAVAAWRYFAGLVLVALDGRSKERLLGSFFYPGFDRDYWHRQPLPGEIAEIANGAPRAVNLRDDADTTGAIYGQLAGAYYGINAIPRDWIKRLALCELISEKATVLFDFSNA